MHLFEAHLNTCQLLIFYSKLQSKEATIFKEQNPVPRIWISYVWATVNMQTKSVTWLLKIQLKS